MVFSEKEIAERNQEAQLVTIQEKIDSKTIELADILKKRDDALSVVSLMSGERSLFEKEKKEFYEDKKLKIEEFTKLEETCRLELSDLTRQTINVKESLKTSTKELERINFSCINGRIDLENLANNKIALERQISYLTDLVTNAETARARYVQLSIDLSAKELEWSNFVIKMKEEKDKHREELAQLANDTQIILFKKDLAESQLKSYTDNLYTAMNDYNIIKTRLEDKWGQTFPELAIPLLM